MPDTKVRSSFLPRLLQRQLAAGDFPDPPRAQLEDAVLLLGDIEGSTGIVERVGKAGSLALETLTAKLSAFFSDFIDIIYAHGGDVIFIAGDAFLCYWPAAQTGGLPAAATRAAAAGLLVQQELGDRDDGFGNPLRLRIGLGAGELTRAFVGGEHGRWELVLAGSAFDQVALTEPAAQAGSVLASRECWALLEGDFSGVARPDGVELASLPPQRARALAPAATFDRRQLPATLSGPAMRPYLPAAVVARSGASSDWLVEYRRLSVLMADLPGNSLKSQQELNLLHRCILAFQQLVGRFEASIKVDVDNKGVMLLAVFGLPPMAHEDDASRAVQAGCMLKERLQALDVHCGIGIASGRALYAPLGNDLRREYMVRGDVINRAARLMHTTSSEIVCDQATCDEAREAIEFEPLPMQLLKGIGDAVGVMRPTGIRKASAPSQRKLIGRRAELETLEALLLESGTRPVRGTVIIEAEAGLGKSSLLEALARRAVNHGFRILRGRADAVERTSAFFAWRGVFAGLFGLSEDADAVTRRERVIEGMRRYDKLTHLTPLLSTVLGVDIPDNASTAVLEGEARAASLRYMLTGILDAVLAPGNFLLLLEDLHWIDSQSLELLSELARTDYRGSIVVAMRPPEPSFPDLTSLEVRRLMRLASMAEEDARAFIAQRVGVAEVPEELVTPVRLRSGGNPFFMEQIIKAMIEEGAIIVDRGACRLADRESLSIPASVEGVIVSRLDRLPELERELVKTASILGQLFSLPEVQRTAAAVAASEEQIEDAFRKLERAGFVETVAGDEAGHYRFRHVITRDVTYDTLSGAQRSAGHAACAEWLETDEAHRATRYPLLAHHWSKAGDHRRALTAAEKAGALALRDGSFPEALALFEQCERFAAQLGIDARTRRAASWQMGAGTAAYFMGNMDHSRAQLEAAVSVLDRPLPTSSVKLTRQLLAGLLRQLAFRDRRRPQLELEEIDTYNMVVDAYRMLGQLYFLEGERAERLAFLTVRGLNIGELAGDSKALACIMINMSYTMSLLGFDGQSDRYAGRAKAMASDESARGAAAYVWHIDALRHAQHADWDQALTSNARAESLMVELGDFTLATESAAIRSTLVLCVGDLAAAEQTTRLARQAAKRSGNDQYLCWALLDEVEIALGQGDLSSAESSLAQALAIETEDTDLSSRLDKLRATLLVRQRQGRVDDSLEAADEICELIRANPPTSYYFLDFYGTAVEAYVDALGQPGKDPQLARKAGMELKRIRQLSRTFWNVRPKCLLLSGRLKEAAGGNGTAQFRKSLATARELRMPRDEAYALAAMAAAEEAPSKSAQEAGAILKRLHRRHDLHALLGQT